MLGSLCVWLFLYLWLWLNRGLLLLIGGAHTRYIDLIETRRRSLDLEVEALGALENILGLSSEFPRQFVYPYLRHSFLRAVNAIRSLLVIGRLLLI